MKKSKKLDNNGEWKIKHIFESSVPEDFWEVVNGHDYVNMLKLVYGKNLLLVDDINKVESFLIKNYNREKFLETHLYSKLKNVGIVE